MVVNDLWGRITIDKKYEKIINSKEFCSMKNKTQLGLNCNANATHTRYQHCIGTFYLACKLIEICKRKFSDVLDITREDEEAVKIMALVHDIGHGCFSHVSEKYLEGSHEDRTEAILLDETSEVHNAIVETFGKEVLDRTIYLLKMKEMIKEHGEVKDSKNLMLVIGKLLSGGIDIDRIDYIFRDSKNTTGETNDFSSILDSIDLECVEGSLEVIFDEDAEFKIANFFNKRFELYDTMYVSTDTKILEEVFGKFLKKAGITLTWDTTEIEMKNIFREFLTSDDMALERYASLLSSRTVDDGIVKVQFDNESSYNYFCQRLLSKVPKLENYAEVLHQSHTKISVYSKDNVVLINKNGLIQDISESSRILNSDLKKDNYIVAVDIKLLKLLLKRDNVPESEIKKIVKNIKKAMAAEIEQEKKYTIKEDSEKSPEEIFAAVKEKLGLSGGKDVENIDTYYDYNGVLESRRINVRRRESAGKVEWTVKKPLNDKSSISKRDEKNFQSMEEVLGFLQTEWKVPVKELKEVVTLKTKRKKYDLEYGHGTFEVCFDETIASLNGQEYEPSYMIECELKSGNSTGLYFIDEIIKTVSDVLESNLSKKEIALNKIRAAGLLPAFEEDSTKVEYEAEIATFFVGSPRLFEDLKMLDEKKNQIRRMREKYGNLKTPLVVTISGTPRAGKTTCVDNLEEFLKKADLKTTSLMEPAGLVYATLKNREEKKKLLQDRVGFVERQYEVGTEAITRALDENDVIICDRGNIDPFIWYDMYYRLGMISEEQYRAFLSQLLTDKTYFNQFYALYADSDISMHRDYINSLSLEPRTTMNKANVERYNSSLLRLMPMIEKACNGSMLIDTSRRDRMDASLIVANDVLERARKLF